MGLTDFGAELASVSLRPSGFAPAYGQCGCAFRRGFDARAKEGAEKVPERAKSVPQRLKPHSQHAAYGTAKAVPLSAAVRASLE